MLPGRVWRGLVWREGPQSRRLGDGVVARTWHHVLHPEGPASLGGGGGVEYHGGRVTYPAWRSDPGWDWSLTVAGSSSTLPVETSNQARYTPGRAVSQPRTDDNVGDVISMFCSESRSMNNSNIQESVSIQARRRESEVQQ